MKLSEHKIYVDAWKYEAVMLFDKPDDTRHYAEMLVEAHDAIAQLKEENDARRDELYKKTGKAFWEGHIRGRIYGREGISKEEITACAKWLDALLAQDPE